MKNNLLLNQIFSKTEVLISCSSLKTLDLSNFRCTNEEKPLFVSPNFMKLVFKNFKLDMAASALRVANNVVSQNPNATKVDIISNIFLNRRYRRGLRADNNPKMINEMVSRCVEKNKSVTLTISLFPCKIPNRLKSAGDLPDLAEIASIARLAEIGLAVSHVYEPGSRVIVLTDGLRFKHILDFNIEILKSYQLQMLNIVKALGVGKYVELVDYAEIIDKFLPPEKLIEKNNAYQSLLQEYFRIVGEKITLNNPLKFIKNIQKKYPKSELVEKITHLYFALIYCNYYPEIFHSKNPDNLSKKVFCDPFNFTDENQQIVNIRKKIVTKTWEITSKYVAEIASGRLIKPIEIVYPDSIRCDMHNIKDRLTLYSVDRSTPLTAFHGTGFIDSKLRAGTRFRVSLQAENFRPVYGSLFNINYTKQPLFYMPMPDNKLTKIPDNIALNIHLR